MIRVDLQLARPIGEPSTISPTSATTTSGTSSRTSPAATPGPIGPGARFQGIYDRMGVLEYEIIDYQRPGHLFVRGKSASFDFVSTFDFVEQPGGCKVLGTMDPQPKGVMRLLKP